MASKKDEKNYLTDVLETKDIFRLIDSIPIWLASLEKDRID